MELRKRRRSKRNRISGSYSGCVFLMCAVFLALTLLIGFSKAGTVLAETVFQPLFSREQTLSAPDASTSEPDAATTPADADKARDESAVTKRVTIPAFTCHALQMGAFSEEENARRHALTISKLGAAGYVYGESGESYRVLAAGYLTDEELTAVRTQLREEFIDSMPFVVSTEACTLSVYADGETAGACEEALQYPVLLARELITLSIRFDRESMETADGIFEVQSIRTAVQKRLDTLLSLPEAGRTTVQPLINCLEQAALKMEELANKQEADAPAFSSALKYLSLMYVNDLAEGVKNLAR